MTDERYANLVQRLEGYSQAHPRRYQAQVAALALLGFGVMALLLGLAGAGLLALAALALAMLTSGGGLLVLLLKLGKFLILLALPLWFLIKHSLKALFVKFPQPEGTPVRPEQAPALFAAIERMRRELRGPAVHHVLITDEVNAAVVQRPLFGLFGWPRNYLLLGLPLLERMSPDEALAVVAHEYGHLAGSHGRFGAWIYRLRHTWATLQDVAAQWDGAMGRMLQRLVGAYAPYFNAYTHVLARANEYAADRASCDLVGAPVAAQALKRVNLVGPQHQAFLEGQFGQVRERPEPPADLSLRWAAEPAPQPQQALGWLNHALQRQPQLHDTHPALAQRLQALPAAGAVEELPPLELAQSAAQQWLGASLPPLREQLARAWRERVASPWRQQHEAYAEQRAELAKLQALESPDREQWLQRLRLQSALEPGFDAVPAYVEFNASHPDDLGGLFSEGVARLAAADEQGLSLLEQVMAREPDAILPACAAAHEYLAARNDPRAQAYAERWRAREQLLNELHAQAHQLDPRHALVDAGLDTEQRRWIQELLAERGRGVRRAYVARRVLPADPSHPSYVLALEFGWWARRRGRQMEVIRRLVDADWPWPLHCCELDGPLKPLRKRLRALPGAEVAIRAR